MLLPCDAPPSNITWPLNAHVDDTGQLADVAAPKFGKLGPAFCRWHERLRDEASAYTAAPEDDDNVTRLAFVGDSMVASLRGVLQSTLVGWPNPLLLGSGGDETQHVLWRLAQGELSQSMSRDPHLLMVLLVGTNNLAGGHRSHEVVAGIEAIARYVLSTSRTRMLIVGLLPRGDRWRLNICPRPYCDRPGELVPLNTGRPSISGTPTARKYCPSVCAVKRIPRSWKRSVDAVNAQLNDFTVPALAQRYGSQRVRFADCTQPFRARTDRPPLNGTVLRMTPSMAAAARFDVDITLMPDGLHPSASGYGVLMSCLAEELMRLCSVAGSAAYKATNYRSCKRVDGGREKNEKNPSRGYDTNRD
jgi:hypothetical protein